ncbi:MAG: M48 family metalloprotease, partial [Sphaerochaetaceae bacterium]|nr:M48 family metalloprotease [Sphaerochaetaceae bacterium]
MKRKFILTFIILFFVLANINSASYESLEDLKMVSTEHFDIIYNDESSASASLIEEKCESIYNEIITSFALNRTQRFYVVVTTQRQMFNSYFTAYQTPRIVMFDTITDSNSFNSNKYNNFLNVFRHELTHALTLTTENGFFQKYVSQLISFYNISTTRFAKEGIAVLSESLLGSGRLNDPLYKSILIRSKVDGFFPSYYDVQDAQVGFKNDNYYLYGGF